MSSTFDGLFIARSGVRAARASLNITGQNITNSTTPGYTRQRVDQAAVTPPSTNSFYSWAGGAVSGQGADAYDTSQLRDAFLDGEYRLQNALGGESSALAAALEPLEDIFTYTTTADSSDEVSTVDVLSNELSNLISQMQNLTSGKSDASESVIRDAADQLAKKFNIAAKGLETAREQQYDALSEHAVPQVNELLSGIAALNGQIKNAEVSGGSALELRDQRNLKLDELSQYMDIRVEETEVDVGSGKTVHELNVYLADKDGNALEDGDGNPEFTLVSNKKYAKVSVFQDADAKALTHARLSGLTEDGETFDTAKAEFQNADLQSGSLAGYLKLLNENGEYDISDTQTTATFRGIGYYSKLLDTLAQTFATTMNGLNSTTDAQPDKPLFTSNGFSADGITARNLQISSDWTSVYLTMSKDSANAGDDTSTSYSNITNMITALTSDEYTLETKPGEEGSDPFFTGTLQKAFMNVPTSLARSVAGVKSTDADNANRLDDIDTSRQSISSVSIDDEAVSLVQYNQALTASARFMTAVDECLQTIISSMGVAGRG